MKVRIKQNIVGLDFSYSVGDEPDIKKGLAEDLIRAGHAEEIKTATKKKSNTKKSGDK